MAETWEVIIEPFVFGDLLATGLNPLDAVTLSERILALCRRLAVTGGNSPDGFLLETLSPPMPGFAADRILVLFRRQRIRYRTWRNLWLRSRERRIISIRLMRLLAA